MRFGHLSKLKFDRRMTSRFPQNSILYTLAPRKIIYKHTCCSYDAPNLYRRVRGFYKHTMYTIYTYSFFCPLSLFGSVIQTHTHTHTQISERAHTLGSLFPPVVVCSPLQHCNWTVTKYPTVKYVNIACSSDRNIKTTTASEHIIIIILCTPRYEKRNNISELGCSTYIYYISTCIGSDRVSTKTYCPVQLSSCSSRRTKQKYYILYITTQWLILIHKCIYNIYVQCTYSVETFK